MGWPCMPPMEIGMATMLGTPPMCPACTVPEPCAGSLYTMGTCTGLLWLVRMAALFWLIAWAIESGLGVAAAPLAAVLLACCSPTLRGRFLPGEAAGAGAALAGGLDDVDDDLDFMQ